MTQRDTRVFINCPFDARYKPIFDAIVFAIHDLGYVATHALNKDGGGALRLPRIHKQLLDCAYSIHDLSRVDLSGKLQLPRFNMPFEAGIAYALHEVRPHGLEHNLLILDKKPYRYQASVSDLAGLDPKIHNDKPLMAIEAVREFFSQHNSTIVFNQADYIKRRFLTFQNTLPAAARAEKIKIGNLRSWKSTLDLQRIMVKWIRDHQ